MIDYDNYISKLDTNRFGFKVAKINEFGKEPMLITNELKKLDVKLIISRIDGKEIDLINMLEDIGYKVKDNQLTYRYDIKNLENVNFKNLVDCNIREVKEEDIPAIKRFTEESFAGYGHYFADKRLDEKICMEIYKDWAVRSCTDKNVADKVFVAEINNEPVGYLTFKIYKKDNFMYAAGGLGTVDKRFRNKSIFQAITIKGLYWGKEINLDWEEHNVLSTNYPVNRTFSKLGFGITESYVTLHNWL